MQRLASGVGDEQTIYESPGGIPFATDWSADGKQLLIGIVENPNADIMTVAADGHGAPSPVVATPAPSREINGRFSPDNRWFAYQSNESGRFEIYVQSFPPSGGKWQISSAGGNAPMWRGDGKELFYQTTDDTFYAVAIKVAGNAIEVGLPGEAVPASGWRPGHARPQRVGGDARRPEIPAERPARGRDDAQHPGRAELGGGAEEIVLGPGPVVRPAWGQGPWT